MTAYMGVRLTELVPTTVGRCYFASPQRTVCNGYVGEILTMIASSLNFSLVNHAVRSCGTSSDPDGRVVLIGNGVRSGVKRRFLLF